MAIVIVMDGVHTRAGKLSQTFPIAGQFKPPAPWERLTQFGLLIHWERKYSWLNITARLVPQTGTPIHFGSDLAGLDDICAKHDVQRAQLAPPAFLESCIYLAASLPSANSVEVVVEVDTDDPCFKDIVETQRDATTKNVVMAINLIYFDQKQFKQYVQKSSSLSISFKPCKPLPKFNGAMAIDFGNAVSTMVSLSESSRVYETDSVQIVPFDKQALDPTLLTTAIRFDEVETPDLSGSSGTRRLPSLPSDDSTKHFRFAVGRAALAGAGATLEGVVVGVKQLLSVPAYENGNAPEGREPHFPLNIPHRLPGTNYAQNEQMEVMNHFPGELVFAHMISRFRAEMKAWPADLVLTYPTTYTRGELKQLVSAAARGWLRAMQQPQSLEISPEPSGDMELDTLVTQVRGWINNPGRMTNECPIVKLAIDEATAAGFFHIHRRIFEKPGSLSRFRYLKPNGTHALVIDCGGGTTDVVLIHATAPSIKNLKLDILARTGLRGFGGDHITREVCRILKAKLTLTMAKVLNAATLPPGGLTLPATGPADPGQAATTVQNFLKKVDALRNPVTAREYVSTRFQQNDLSAEATTARAAFRALWRMGDEIKRRLGEGKPVKLSTLPGELLRKETSALIRLMFDGLTPQLQTQLTQMIGDVSLTTWEVDALVRKQVLQIITKCNKLMATKVKPLPSGLVPEVDWVVLSGNGARYPLVQSMCKELLNVAFLDSADEDRFTFDSENLKHAVAKGAVMARLMSRVARTATVEYPPNLSERLPFEVGRQELDAAIMQTVFREFTMYTDLMNQPAQLKMETGVEGQPQTVVLERKFPGDERWMPFGSYHFPNGVTGHVEAVYDNDENRFRVTASGEESLFTDLTDPLEHISPQNRGDF